MEVKVPDIGDFTDIPVLSVLVSVGDTVSAEDPLLELESDKATMEVPSPADGVITAISVTSGDLVSEGSLVMMLETQDQKGTAAAPAEHAGQASNSPVSESAVVSAVAGTGDLHAEVLVLGSGPGGYTAAFRAADLGLKTVLIESLLVMWWDNPCWHTRLYMRARSLPRSVQVITVSSMHA